MASGEGNYIPSIYSLGMTGSFRLLNPYFAQTPNILSTGNRSFITPPDTISMASFPEIDRSFIEINKNIPVPEWAWDKLCNSIVIIQLINNKKKYNFTTGFFMSIIINNKKYKSLITSALQITEEDILNKIVINIYYGPKNKHQKLKIRLDRNKRFIHSFIDLQMDAILMEILNKDNVPNDKYLTPDYSYNEGYDKYKDNFIYLAGYPEESNERCVSSGKIFSINNNEFSHSLNKIKITNGSPICNEKCEIIGINTSLSLESKDKNNHSGNFIGGIIMYLNEEINNK